MGLWSELGKAALKGMKAIGEAMDPNNHYARGYDDGQSGSARYQYVIYPPTDPAYNNIYQANLQCRDAYNRGYDDGTRERLIGNATSMFSQSQTYQCSYCRSGTVNSLPAYCPSCGKYLSLKLN